MTAMKAININTQTDYHKYDKWFTIAKVLLTLAPFIALIYMQAFIGGSNLSELLQQNPEITLTFLVSMAGPFTAYLLSFAQKHLYEEDVPYMMAHLALLFAVELLLRNGVYALLMGCLMFLVYRMTGMSPLEALRLKWKDHFFRDLSGCIVLMVFAMFCLFVSLRLGM
ncbi:MAG: hypothetical protein HFI19_17180 [Lachnospiraceae bacterium]|jgi:hypothetical protein|uniref:hypothetical protein n=1 Tax=Candidatus Merdisoma sp. JLR.KK006 TaxID=3112626 RepID=UPI002FEF59C0|nr:hypothetical protein [Lachnospiraceae bacterium]